MGLSFTIPAGPRQRSHPHVRLMTNFLLSQIRDSPDLGGGAGTRMYTPQEQVGSVIPPR
jgi:hypothetical protein